ncbi:MAG: ribosome biogenesis GTPase Der [Acidiferrobacterales bacterium]
MKPVVALVGRPNVGKSTLFNRLTKKKAALVIDEPGITRDRQYGTCEREPYSFFVIDTGGITDLSSNKKKDSDNISHLVALQTQQAIDEADYIVLMVDRRTGLQPQDQDIANTLRKQEKPVFLVVNKSEGVEEEFAVSEFYELSLGEPVALSASQGDNIDELLELLFADRDFNTEQADPDLDIPRVAFVGRPNVGKSTLINSLLGAERVLVFDQPGTTRDSVHVPFELNDKSYMLIDTAGLRRRGKITETVEKFSGIKTLQSIDEANIVILVIDTADGVTDQDATLAGHILEKGCALVVVLNKWDLLDTEKRNALKEEVNRRLPFLSFANHHYLSALKGTGLKNLFLSVDKAYAAAIQVLPTSLLTRILEQATTKTSPPMVRGRRVRLKFAHQAGKNPPKIMIHGNKVDSVPEHYKRYLVNCYRKKLNLAGTPVRIDFKASENPYKGRRAKKQKKKVYKKRK